MTYYIYIGSNHDIISPVMEALAGNYRAYKDKTSLNQFIFQYEMHYDPGKTAFRQLLMVIQEHMAAHQNCTVEITHALSSNIEPYYVKDRSIISVDQLTAEHLMQLPEEQMIEVIKG
ncbi:hypothetical protein ERX35_007610 [Macrococcus equipercicus]|uniref:Uncharacterized protein n=1 Tax=Macrococcus equipercicus TaxID=69967 RepID=A0ABQ6R7J7_9STAP|nr:hypothetical protein [Macrococcus equipercicus]KAA1039072.1 hypothetical protein ERX35_007610 [Macrococcus equipercicus]